MKLGKVFILENWEPFLSQCQFIKSARLRSSFSLSVSSGGTDLITKVTIPSGKAISSTFLNQF